MIKNADDQAAIIEAIHRQVEAEQATAAELRRQNDLAEKTLIELQRQRSAEQQRVKLAFETNDRLSGLLGGLQRAFRDIRQINKRLGEADRRAERTDDILLLLLTERSNQKIEEAREDLEAEMAERKDIQRKLLRQHRRNLNKLQQQAANYGLDVPLHLQNEIEAEEQAIAELRERR